jgi:hypothetical protein
MLTTMLDTYQVTGRLRRVYERLGRVARVRAAGPAKVWFSGYVDAEGKAYTIRIWQPLIMPGLVQTERYARALYTAMSMPGDQITEQLGLRMGRQAILSRPNPPNVTIVLWEPVLHHMIGSPEIMSEQLSRLAELSRSITIQVVPSETGGNAGLGGAVSLVEGPGGPVLLANAVIEDQVTTDTSLVLRAGATFDAVRGDALPRAQSRNLISEANERWNS